MKYEVTALVCLVDKYDHSELTVHEYITFQQVCLYGPLEYWEAEDLAIFHYGCKMLRDAMRDPAIKEIVKRRSYSIDVMDLTVILIGD